MPTAAGARKSARASASRSRKNRRRANIKRAAAAIEPAQLDLADFGLTTHAGSPNWATSVHGRTWALPSGPTKIAHSLLSSHFAIHIDRFLCSWTYPEVSI